MKGTAPSPALYAVRRGPLPDDFWPTIKSIYDQAMASWEMGDSRMKYVTVQIDKVDLPTLAEALGVDPSVVEGGGETPGGGIPPRHAGGEDAGGHFYGRAINGGNAMNRWGVWSTERRAMMVSGFMTQGAAVHQKANMLLAGDDLATLEVVELCPHHEAQHNDGCTDCAIGRPPTWPTVADTWPQPFVTLPALTVEEAQVVLDAIEAAYLSAIDRGESWIILNSLSTAFAEAIANHHPK